MIIPDNVSIEFKSSNIINKKDFILKGFLISLAPLIFMCACYLFLKKFMGPVFYFIIVFIFYIVISFMTCNKLFKEYKKYFSGDELALSNNTLYYNICMNKAGVYTFLDSSVLLKDVNNVLIKKGIGPDRLYVFLKDETYLTFHCLKDIEIVKKNIENKLNK